MELVDIVDDKDNVVGKTTYEKIYTAKPLHRIIHVLIFDNKNRLLLQKRSKRKSYLPGYWCTSAGGHVQSGESYKQAAIRETEEELGLKPDLSHFRKYLYIDHTRSISRFLGVFDCKYTGKFKKTDEVEETKYISLKSIQKMIKDGEKFHPELLYLLKKEFSLSIEQPRAVTKEETWLKKISNTRQVIEYNNGQFKTVDVAKVINNESKYKDDFAVNKVCTLNFYCLKGSMKIQTKLAEHIIKKDEVFILPKGTAYRFMGNFAALVISSPAWYPEQYSG